jgi:CRP-like cAMP-binding protein
MSTPTISPATLQGIGLFAEFTGAELEGFCDLLDPVFVSVGGCIVRQDDPGDCMFVLLTGRAKVVHRKADRKFDLAELKPGDFFGELALVDEGPRSADVEAIEDCTLLSISQAVVRALAGVYPSAAFKLLISVGRVMVKRMRQGNQKYIDSLLLLKS